MLVAGDERRASSLQRGLVDKDMTRPFIGDCQSNLKWGTKPYPDLNHDPVWPAPHP